MEPTFNITTQAAIVDDALESSNLAEFDKKVQGVVVGAKRSISDPTAPTTAAATDPFARPLRRPPRAVVGVIGPIVFGGLLYNALVLLSTCLAGSCAGGTYWPSLSFGLGMGALLGAGR